MTKRLITGIDVGTTKICTIVATLDSGGALQVLGVGQVPSHGLHKGMVVNVDEARDSVAESVKEQSRQAALKLNPRTSGSLAGISVP